MLFALRRLLAFVRRSRLDDDLAEEIQLHLELRRQSLIADGLSPGEAEREARRQFGNVTAIRERARDQWGGSSIDALVRDVRYGLRMIARAPGFSLVAIASLAFGIGASTVVFSFANSVLFRPIQAANAEQLMRVFTSDSRGTRYGGTSYADYEVFRETSVFGGLAASARATATLSSAEHPDVLQGLLVSGNFFDVLGLRPSLGRFFLPEEHRTAAAHPVVVLSDHAWQRRFAADPAIVGREIELNGHAFTVIGVAPRGFSGTNIEERADFFAPAMMQAAISPPGDLLRSRTARVFHLLGRLASGVTLPQADAALRVVAAQLLEQDPAAWRDRNGRGRVITVLPEIDTRFITGAPGAKTFIFASVMAAVVGLLAIACVNVATVLLARATTRRKEIAVRLAIGASRRRVIRQLLTESALLAAAGGTLGLLLTHYAAALFLRFRPDEVPAFDLTIDYRILIFNIGASVSTVVLFGLAPALQTTRPDVNSELKDAARDVRVRRVRFGLRSSLVVVQVALSLAFIIGAALMLRSVHAGRTIETGFRRDGVLNVGINLSTLPDRNGSHGRYYQEAVREVAALPGVERAALAALVPLDGSNSQIEFRVPGEETLIAPDINIVGAGYFALLEIPLKTGREFTGADVRSASAVAIVNELMAQQFWNGDALGRTLTDGTTGRSVEVVGVVADLRHRSFDEQPRPMVYLCAQQRPGARMTLHVRTALSAAVLGPVIHQTLRTIDRTAGLTRVETMHEYFDRVTTPQRFAASGALLLAVVELALVVMALYGVIAFAASQRRREIGVRVALGATRRSVLALMMREGLVLTAAGIALGTALALGAAAALTSLLIGVGPADPLSFGAAIALVASIGAAASYIPARRVLRVDPSAALRSE